MNNYDDSDDYNCQCPSAVAPPMAEMARDDVITLLHADADNSYDGLPPADFQFQTREEALRQSVEVSIADFKRVAAAQPDEVYWHLSHSCLALASFAGKSRAERISRDLCDRLTRSIVAARFALARHAPDSAAGVLLRGFDGLFVLAAHLAETDEERAARHPHVLRDAFDFVRVMRNCAHNECLTKGIRERAQKRRAATTTDIINGALEHLPQFRSDEAA